jgi:hypothetical protein
MLVLLAAADGEDGEEPAIISFTKEDEYMAIIFCFDNGELLLLLR